MSATDKHARGVWGRLYDGLIEFVYPPQCVICESLHEGEHFFICPRCENSLEKRGYPFCLKCRNPISPHERSCKICGGRPVIAEVWSLGEFDDFYRPLIHAFKYGGLLPAGKYMSHRLAETIRDGLGIDAIDHVIPIPLHPSRQRKRGFNQSQLIAKIIGRTLNCEYSPDSLVRIKKTRDQTGLNQRERIDNMRGAFALRGDWDLSDKRILLVDDVTTTGATATEAAQVLKAGGARRISLAVIAAAGLDVPGSV
jgi:competence protein ComFC